MFNLMEYGVIYIIPLEFRAKMEKEKEFGEMDGRANLK